MVLPDFTVEHLKQLPLRAIVAFAARCARRVESLAQSQVDGPEREHRGAVIEAAIQTAEKFAAGTATAVDPSIVTAIDAVAAAPSGSLSSRNAAAAAAQAAHAAICARNAILVRETKQYKPPLEGSVGDEHCLPGVEHESVELVALEAFTAATEAYAAVGYENRGFVLDALDDYNRLLRLKLGSYPELGAPIDPSPHGPLGRL